MNGFCHKIHCYHLLLTFASMTLIQRVLTTTSVLDQAQSCSSWLHLTLSLCISASPGHQYQHSASLSVYPFSLPFPHYYPVSFQLDLWYYILAIDSGTRVEPSRLTWFPRLLTRSPWVGFSSISHWMCLQTEPVTLKLILNIWSTDMNPFWSQGYIKKW